MNRNKKLLSIICPSYNVEGCIRFLIESVICQTSNNYEFIIVDGGSTDNTVSILEEYNDRIKFVSEKDNGIYDAMNKGVNLSSGEWLYFIGADDSLYTPDVIDRIEQHLYDDSIDVLLCKIQEPKVGILDSDLNYKMMFKNFVNHQGAIYRKRIFENYNYNLAYKISSDYDFNMYVWKKGYKFKKVDVIFAIHSFAGISGQAHFISYKEELQIRRKYVKSNFINIIGFFYTISRYLFRKVRVNL